MNYIEKFEEYEREYERKHKELTEKLDYLRETNNRLLEPLEEQINSIDNEIEQLEEKREKLKEQVYHIIDFLWQDKKEIEIQLTEYYKGESVTFSVGQLKNELSMILGENIDVEAKLQCDISMDEKNHSKEEIIKNYFSDWEEGDYEESTCPVAFDMNVKGTPFSIRIRILNQPLYRMKEDESTIYDYCTQENYYHNFYHRYRSRLKIDDNIDDIMIKISFKDLATIYDNVNIKIHVSKDGYYFYSLDDFAIKSVKQAILNIMEKQNKKEYKRLNLQK